MVGGVAPLPTLTAVVNLLALVADTPLAAVPEQRDEFAGWLVGGTLRMIIYGAFEPPMWDIAVVGRDLTRCVPVAWIL